MSDDTPDPAPLSADAHFDSHDEFRNAAERAGLSCASGSYSRGNREANCDLTTGGHVSFFLFMDQSSRDAWRQGVLGDAIACGRARLYDQPVIAGDNWILGVKGTPVALENAASESHQQMRTLCGPSL